MASSFPALGNYARVILEAVLDNTLLYVNFTPGEPNASFSPNHLEDEKFAVVKLQGGGEIQSGDPVFIQANNDKPQLFLTNRHGATGYRPAPVNFSPTPQGDEVFRIYSLIHPSTIRSGSAVNIRSMAITHEEWYLGHKKGAGEQFLRPNFDTGFTAEKPKWYIWNKKDLTDIAWLVRCIGIHESVDGIPLDNNSGQLVRIIFQNSSAYNDALYVDLPHGKTIRLLGDGNTGYMALWSGAITGNYRLGERSVPSAPGALKFQITPQGEINPA